MKNVNKMEVKKAVVFEDNDEKLVLIENETVVTVTTDETDFEKEYTGLITFVDEGGIEVEASELIHWEYIKEIEIR